MSAAAFFSVDFFYEYEDAGDVDHIGEINIFYTLTKSLDDAVNIALYIL